MSTSLGSNPTNLNTNTLNELLTVLPSEQRKRAALDLAELVYDVFVANKANASMEQKG